MRKFQVALSRESSRVWVGADLSRHLKSLKLAGAGRRAFLFVDGAVKKSASLWEHHLKASGWSVEVRWVEASEALKSLSSLEPLYRWLIDQGADRQSVIFAIGGGTVGDAGVFCFTKGTISPSHGPTGTVARACAVIPFGTSKVVPLTISFDRPYAGSLGGAFVDAYSALQSTPDVHTPFRIPITGVVQLPPIPTTTDQGTFWTLVILSFLLALAIWAGASLLAARLKDPETVNGWSATVRIEPGSTAIEQLPTDPKKWKFLDRGTGRFALKTRFPGDPELPLVLSFRARIRLWALQDVVVSREGHVAYGSMGAVGRVGSSAALIAHKIQGEWVFTVPIGTKVPADGETAVLEGELFFFVRDGAITSESDPSGVFASAQRGVSAGYSEIVGQLRRAVPKQVPKQKEQEPAKPPVEEQIPGMG